MVYKLIRDFLQFDSFNVSSTKWTNNLTLPAISICGTNFINYTALSTQFKQFSTGSDNENLLEDFDHLLTDLKKFSTYGNVLDHLDLYKYRSLLAWEAEHGSITLNFRTGIYDMLVGEWDYLFRGSGFVIENPAKLVNPTALGLCLELNDGGNMKQDISGANGGIVLDLDAKVRDYLFTTATKGFVIFIRDQDETLMLNKAGYLVSPGTEAYLKLSARSVTRLGKPHGTCQNNLSKYSKYGKRFESVRECKQRQRIDAMVENCGCIPWYFANRMISMKKSDVLDEAVEVVKRVNNEDKEKEEGTSSSEDDEQSDPEKGGQDEEPTSNDSNVVDPETDQEEGGEEKGEGVQPTSGDDNKSEKDQPPDGNDNGDSKEEPPTADNSNDDTDEVEPTQTQGRKKKRSLESTGGQKTEPFRKLRSLLREINKRSVRKKSKSRAGPPKNLERREAPTAPGEFVTEWWPTEEPIHKSKYSEYICTFTIQAVCDSVIEEEIKKGELEMEGCPEPCSYNEWDVELATTVFPSTEKYFDSFIKFEVYVDPAPDFTYARENMARVHIFYDDIKYDIQEQEKAYEEQNFIAEFGGTVDLFIGFSFFTIFQLIEIALAACVYKCMCWKKGSATCERSVSLPSLDERDLARGNGDFARAKEDKDHEFSNGKVDGETIEVNILSVNLDERDKTNEYNAYDYDVDLETDNAIKS